jgi:dolichyl-phosphate-mannose--protein O-mannosyl transferase
MDVGLVNVKATRSLAVTLRAALLVPLALLVLAGGVRLIGLSHPRGTYWDENYYAFDAYRYVGGMPPDSTHALPPAPTISADSTWMHPPLGKWMIALGVAPTHFSDTGMRLPSAIFGIAGVMLVYFIALELWGSVWAAGLAGFLVALDGLDIVQSRMAMLDIFLSTFALAGVFFLLRDRERIRAGDGSAGSRLDRWFGTRERFWAGVMLGAAASVKWNGAWPLVLAAGLTWSWLRQQRAHTSRHDLATVLRAFVAVPIAVYLLSYWQFFVQHPFGLLGWVRLQWYMLAKQAGPHAVTAANSRAWTWPLLLHPIRYWTAPAASGTGFDPARGIVLAIGNPVLFWGFLVVLPFALWRSVRSSESDLRIILAFYAVLLLPWMLTTRTQYIYYILPCVPFMALTIAGTLRTVAQPWARRIGVSIGLLASAVAALFMPVWLGLPTSTAWLSTIHWLPGWK